MIGRGRLSSAIALLLFFYLCTTPANAKNAGVFRPGVVQEGIVALGLRNFDNAVQDIANPLWLIEFHAPWYVHAGFHACTPHVGKYRQGDRC